MKKLFYSTTIFRTAGSDVVLWILTHNLFLFACLHESMSCVNVFFSTCLPICVLRAAC